MVFISYIHILYTGYFFAHMGAEGQIINMHAKLTLHTPIGDSHTSADQSSNHCQSPGNSSSTCLKCCKMLLVQVMRTESPVMVALVIMKG